MTSVPTSIAVQWAGGTFQDLEDGVKSDFGERHEFLTYRGRLRGSSVKPHWCYAGQRAYAMYLM